MVFLCDFQRAAEQVKVEVEAKVRAKAESRRINLNPGDLRLSESSLRSLDGSVKKNTAFQRKLVGIVCHSLSQCCVSFFFVFPALSH